MTDGNTASVIPPFFVGLYMSYPLKIADVSKLTGLDYHYVRRALISGELKGLVANRLLRTNEDEVQAWLERLQNKPIKQAAPSVVKPKHRGKASKPFNHLDPNTFGQR